MKTYDDIISLIEIIGFDNRIVHNNYDGETIITYSYGNYIFKYVYKTFRLHIDYLTDDPYIIYSNNLDIVHEKLNEVFLKEIRQNKIRKVLC